MNRLLKIFSLLAAVFIAAAIFTPPTLAADASNPNGFTVTQRSSGTDLPIVNISCNSLIKCGEAAHFAFTADNCKGADPRKYMVSVIAKWEDGNWTNLINPNSQTFRSDPNFDFTFYSNGTYQMRVNVLDGPIPDTEPAYQSSFVTIQFTIADSSAMTAEEKADEIAQECLAQGFTSQYDKALWLHDWLIEHASYSSSGNAPYVSADGVLLRGEGNCESYNAAYRMLLARVGIESNEYRSTGDNHVWSVAKIDGEWYCIDVTADDSSKLDDTLGAELQRHLYFCVNREVIDLVYSNHTGGEAVSATSLKHNYLIKSGRIDEWANLYAADIQTHLNARESSFTIPAKNLGIYYEHDDSDSSKIVNGLIAAVLKERAYAASPATTANLDVSYKNRSFTFTASYEDACNHSNATTWSKDASNHWRTCPDCNVTLDRAQHTGQWVTTRQPSYDSTGLQTYSCNVCGYTSTKEIPALERPYTAHVAYQCHVQNIGWQPAARDGALGGTEGRSLRVEAFRVSLENAEVPGGIRVRSHVQNIGWQGWVYDGADSGTSGQSLRVEALCVELTGQMAERYDVYYRTHVQNIGWTGWAKNGEQCGSEGYAYRMEAVEIKLVPKGGAAPGSTANAFVRSRVSVQTHVQNIGWQGWAAEGTTAGTSGRGLRVEAFRIRLDDPVYSGGIRVRSHVQNIGWQGWVDNGATSGTSGQSLRVEALCVELTGDMAAHYDVYYRTHVQNIGWTGWAKNGEQSGSAGYAYRMEAVEIKLVPKGGSAPGSTSGAFFQR